MTATTGLAAAAITAAVLAGCSAASTPAGTSASSPAATASASPSATVVALTCKQQSDQWKATNKKVLTRMEHAVAPYASGSVTSAQAHQLSADAQAAENVPPPACVDPKGLFGQALAELVTTGAASGGGGSVSELGAMAPLEGALTDLSQLESELLQTIGSKKL
jgi:hypothetical protein